MFNARTGNIPDIIVCHAIILSSDILLREKLVNEEKAAWQYETICVVLDKNFYSIYLTCCAVLIQISVGSRH